MPATELDGRKNLPGDDPGWSETWALDFWGDDGAIGGYISLRVFPHLGHSWFRASLTGPDRPTVMVVADDVPLPRGDTLELRAPALWADLICEVPGDHFTVGLEAFGVALDEPADAYRGMRGHRTPLGFDLEWESGAALPGQAYGCHVHGEVLVGAERLEVEGWGTRSQLWGPPLDAGTSWTGSWGRLGDGSWWTERTGTRIAGFPDRLDRASRQGLLVLVPTGWAPVEVVHRSGQRAHSARALVSARSDDGRHGRGWIELLRHAPTRDTR